MLAPVPGCVHSGCKQSPNANRQAQSVAALEHTMSRTSSLKSSGSMHRCNTPRVLLPSPGIQGVLLPNAVTILAAMAILR